MIKKKKIKLPIYNQFTVTMFLTDDVIGYYNKVTKRDDKGECIGIQFAKGSNIFIGVELRATIGTIAHECFHATAYIMDVIGCELKEESEEPYAYLLGYLVDEFVKFKKQP